MSNKFKYNRLDKDNVAVLLVDHQSGLTNCVHDSSPDDFKNNVLAFADCAKYFELPTILTNKVTRDAAWDRMSQAGAQLVSWFGAACELHRDWRNDVEGLGTLFSNHLPSYRCLMTSYTALKNT